MTERDIYDSVFHNSDVSKQYFDKRPLWKRLLSSLRVRFKIGHSLKQPIKSIRVEGKVEF
jgi:hypothetical protein